MQRVGLVEQRLLGQAGQRRAQPGRRRLGPVDAVEGHIGRTAGQHRGAGLGQQCSGAAAFGLDGAAVRTQHPAQFLCGCRSRAGLRMQARTVGQLDNEQAHAGSVNSGRL